MITYTRDLPADAPQDQVDKVIAHVRAELSARAAADDDPDTNADDVVVRTEDREGRLWVIGELDAEPDAPYLRPEFDAFAGLPPELLEQLHDDQADEQPGGEVTG